MIEKRYPEVHLIRQNSCIRETTRDSMRHFYDERYYRYLMLLDLAEFDRFIKNTFAILEEIAPDRDVAELRTFTWAGRSARLLSCDARHCALLSLLLVCNQLYSFEPQPPFKIRQGLKNVVFPYPTHNLCILLPCNKQR